VVLAVGQRFITIGVTAPAVPNGDIDQYIILANGAAVQSGAVAGNYTLSGLLPFTSYTLAVRACTRGTATAQAGCTVSNITNVTTVGAAPEGQGAPTVEIVGPTSIEVTWTEPTQPNAPRSHYVLNRRPDGAGADVFDAVVQVRRQSCACCAEPLFGCCCFGLGKAACPALDRGGASVVVVSLVERRVLHTTVVALVWWLCPW